MAVAYRGRECFLGNSLGLRLLARLADRPDRYVSYDDLLADVWDGGHRSDAAVRSVVRDLRRRLRAAGLGDLAAAIDGSVSGHYALRPPGRVANPHSFPTAAPRAAAPPARIIGTVRTPMAHHRGPPWHTPTPPGRRPPPVPAAQYVRMSTEHQQYSTTNQQDAIREYARRRGFEVVRTYADVGRSGSPPPAGTPCGR